MDYKQNLKLTNTDIDFINSEAKRLENAIKLRNIIIDILSKNEEFKNKSYIEIEEIIIDTFNRCKQFDSLNTIRKM